MNKVTTKPVVLELPQAHPKQYELITYFDQNPKIRFVVGACGTKFGKTYGCTIALVREAWNNLAYDKSPLPGPGLYWWVAPAYSQAINAYELVKNLLPKDTFEEMKSQLKLTLKTPDGSTRSIIEFKSADDPDILRGFAVNFVVIDEAARIKEASFVSVMTTLTQTRGRAIIISTPKGRGWFYEVYQRGEKLHDGIAKYVEGADIENGGDPWEEWRSIRMQTWSNPHVPLDSIREAKKNLPSDVFQQEYGAEFLQESAGVFRGIAKCMCLAGFQPAYPGEQYVVGVDLAKKRDFTVLTVMNRRTMQVVYWERFNQIEWEIQYTRIISAARRYNNAVVCIDSTGIGDPIQETIRGGGVSVEGYLIGGSRAKQQLIERLRLNLENGIIRIPKDLYILKRELENYEYDVTEGGVVRYSAPSGQHDDAVISLALANWVADQPVWKYNYSQIRGI